LITAKDHGSIQINIGHLDGNGVYTGQFTTFALSGLVRRRVSAAAIWSGTKNVFREKRTPLWTSSGLRKRQSWNSREYFVRENSQSILQIAET